MSDLDETQAFTLHEGNGAVDDNEEVAPIVEAIRARRAEKARDRFYDIDVPGTEGMMVLRLGPIRGAILTQLRERLTRSNSPERETNMNAEVLLRACVGVYVRRTPDAPLIALEKDGEPIKLDKRLADVFGFQASTAREVVFSIFNDANAPDVAIDVAAGRYLEWAASTNVELDDELVGESQGGTASEWPERSSFTASRRIGT